MIANPCPSCRKNVNVKKVKSGFPSNYYTIYCSNCNTSLSKAYQNPKEMLAIWNALYP
ncbi:hypothetical protein [Legionella sp. W05-934-2]|jgi:ribosomal protein L37AE/L43A|uniref:hypothetical protein n=1 Tax=Legionella sp. W05-934-2 TaxID=1198649 RepID=UPI003461DA60